MPSANLQRLIVSTRKGLFYLSTTDRAQWRLSEPQFLGHNVHHAVLDHRDRRTMIAAARTGHLGPTIFISNDAGSTWTEAREPPAFRKAAPGGKAQVVSHTFWVTPGHADEPGRWYAGTSPQALWVSKDGGTSWQGVAGFNDHPDYETRTEDPQGGTPDGPVLHSILIDPRDRRHLYFGLSGGGVYESCDHGESWSPLNDGLSTAFAEANPEEGEVQPGSVAWRPFGPEHDPHCVQMHPEDPDLLYQQNHCGIYRLKRPATRWERIGRNMPKQIGDIGFVIGLHPRDPQTAWVFPMDGTDVWPRTSPDGRPAAYRTRDGGTSWERQERGFPDRGWFTVKRQAMSVDGRDPLGVYVGTTSGEVWGSCDEGENWSALAQHLPEVYAIESVDQG